LSACLLGEVVIRPASSDADLAAARRLFRPYSDWLAIDLCFQGFERELRELPGAYAPPHGCLLLAEVGGETAGCVALRPLEPGIGEIKRLYVSPGFAGFGIGRSLSERALEAARQIGYGKVRLDTIPARMAAAQHLYQALGFRPIPAYYDNPLAGVVMLELEL
jgi:putative acetyltransferase